MHLRKVGEMEFMPPAAGEPTMVGAIMTALKAAEETGASITRTKLAKLLYFADLEAIREGGDPVTGIRWRWREFGPYENALIHIEDNLVFGGLIDRTQDTYHPNGWRLRWLRDQPSITQTSERMKHYITRAVTNMGKYSATELKNRSYRTAPMIQAQEANEREQELDLWLERPVPDITPALDRMRKVLRNLPAQTDDDGVMEELTREHNELAEARARANRLTLGPAS